MASVMKNRIFHQFKNDYFDWSLEAHHCGELLLIDSSYRGACLWPRAVVLDRGDSDLWVCKYGKHDPKFPMPKAPHDQIQSAVKEFGLEIDYARQLKLKPEDLHKSKAASGFLEWCNRHPRLAKEFSHFREHFERMGVTPIGQDGYSGF